MIGGLEPIVKPRIVELSLDEFRALAADLLQEHYRELSRPEPSLDWPAYERLEQAGIAVFLGAMIGADLVGYVVGFVPPRHLKHEECRAHCDLVHVAKSYRGPQFGSDETIGDMLRSRLREVAKSMGAQRLYWRAKKGSAMCNWLDRKGLEVEEIGYMEAI